jgi:Flp pilus assembly protein TadB
LHRAVRRMDAETAAEQRRHRAPAGQQGERRRTTRLERLVAGGSLLIAGVLWTGLATPTWLGWAGAALGLAVLAFAPRRG